MFSDLSLPRLACLSRLFTSGPIDAIETIFFGKITRLIRWTCAAKTARQTGNCFETGRDYLSWGSRHFFFFPFFPFSISLHRSFSYDPNSFLATTRYCRLMSTFNYETMPEKLLVVLDYTYFYNVW